MYPVRILSLNNGWENLLNEASEEWQDIQHALLAMTPEIVRSPSLAQVETEIHIPDKFNAYLSMLVWDDIIKKLGWQDVVVKASEAGGLDLLIKNVKNNVAARMLTTQVDAIDNFNRYMLIDTKRASATSECKIHVMLVAAADLTELWNVNYSEALTRVFFEWHCRAQLKEILPIHGSQSVVIVFFSQYPETLSIEEIPSDHYTVDAITRSIEFEPEYYQAGVGILSYFGEVLRQKHPQINVKFRIEQEGNIVRMHIEPPVGDIVTIEKELEKYALVVAELAPPESLFENRAHVMRLEHKLEVTKLEVKQAQDILQLTRDLTSQRVNNLEREVHSLREQIGSQLLQTGQIINLATRQVNSHERLQLAQVQHSETLFADLTEEAQGNQTVLAAIQGLERNLLSGISTIDIEDKIDAALTTIKQEQPTLLARIAGHIEGAGYGAGVGYVLEWLKQNKR